MNGGATIRGVRGRGKGTPAEDIFDIYNGNRVQMRMSLPVFQCASASKLRGEGSLRWGTGGPLHRLFSTICLQRVYKFECE